MDVKHNRDVFNCSFILNMIWRRKITGLGKYSVSFAEYKFGVEQKG